MKCLKIGNDQQYEIHSRMIPNHFVEEKKQFHSDKPVIVNPRGPHTLYMFYLLYLSSGLEGLANEAE